MLNRIRIAIDKFLMDNFYRIPFLSYDLTFKFDFPTKRLVEHCFDNYCEYKAKKIDGHPVISGKIAMVAHMYSYDSTVSKDKLGLIHAVHDTGTRERVRQILCKFIRENYRKAN